MSYTTAIQFEEEPWTERIEDYVWEKKKEAEKNAEEQKIEGDMNKNMFYMLSIPTVITSAFITFGTNFIPVEYEWVVQFLSTIVTILTGLNLVLNYGDQYATNYSFESRYKMVSSMIKLEMARKPRYRRASDVFTNEIRLRMEFLNSESPEISKINFCGKPRKDDSLYAFYKKNDDILLDII